MSTPVTCGCVAGLVAPPGTTTVAGEMLTLFGLLLTSVTVTPPDGAGDPNKIGYGNEVFRGTVTLDGKVIVVTATTLILIAAGVRFGFADVAWIIVEPGLKLLAEKRTLVEFG